MKSQYREFQVDIPRDRNGEFEPKLIPKYQRDISGIEETAISLYARGISTRDIHDQLQDLYGIELSAEMVSKITDKILPEVKEWQSRPLNPVYPFVFMDCIHYKVREDGRILSRAAYVSWGLRWRATRISFVSETCPISNLSHKLRTERRACAFYRHDNWIFRQSGSCFIH